MFGLPVHHRIDDDNDDGDDDDDYADASFRMVLNAWI